jgi:hypothetical protein
MEVSQTNQANQGTEKYRIPVVEESIRSFQHKDLSFMTVFVSMMNSITASCTEVACHKLQSACRALEFRFYPSFPAAVRAADERQGCVMMSDAPVAPCHARSSRSTTRS